MIRRETNRTLATMRQETKDWRRVQAINGQIEREAMTEDGITGPLDVRDLG
jgi:hypothetical protein